VDDDAAPPRTHLRLVQTPRREEVIDAARPHDDEAEYPYGYDHDADPPPIEPARPPALSPRFVVLGLLAVQVLGALSYLDKYIELTRSTAVSPAAALLSLPAALALYAGALLLMLRPGRGRALFFVAAVGFGIAVPIWGISYGWTWPIAAGSMLGLGGAWVARAAARPAPIQP
jgi:hypothetical protein